MTDKADKIMPIKDTSQERLRRAMARFFERYAPEDKIESAEFHANFHVIVQMAHDVAHERNDAVLRSAIRGSQNAILYPDTIDDEMPF